MEADILLWFQSIRTPVLDGIFNVISLLGEHGLFPIFMCILMMAWRKTRYCGIGAAMSLAAEAIITNVTLKPLIARTRPYVDIDGLRAVSWNIPIDYSFPSGHTGAWFAVASAMMMLAPKKFSVPAAVMAVLVGISRLYLGVHYPTDVLAGAAIGIITGIIASLVIKKIVIPAVEKRK